LPFTCDIVSFSFSFPLSFFFSFSFAFVSSMICCAGVRGSFVGVSLLFTAANQPSFCGDDEFGDDEFDMLGGRRGGVTAPCAAFASLIIAITFSSICLLSSASRRRIISASRRPLSRSRSASASNSASVGSACVERVDEPTLPTSEFIRCAKSVVSFWIDGEGESERAPH
jgi:hypothetical protein